MGAILNSSHENPLLPEFQYFRFYDLSHVGGIWKLFMKKQHSFGYNMDSKLFAQVIGATPASVVGDVQQARDDEKQLSIINSNNNSNGFNNEDYVDGGRRSPTLKIPDSETLYTLFLGRSGSYEVKVSVLEVLCGIIIVCKGSVKEKCKSMFQLFDFDEDGFLDARELSLLFLSCKQAISRMVDLSQSIDHRVEQGKARKSSGGVGKDVKSLSELRSVKDMELYILHQYKDIAIILKAASMSMDSFTQVVIKSKEFSWLLTKYKRVKPNANSSSDDNGSVIASPIQGQLGSDLQRANGVSGGANYGINAASDSHSLSRSNHAGISFNANSNTNANSMNGAVTSKSPDLSQKANSTHLNAILTSFASTIDESNDHNNRRRIDNDSHSHNGPSDGTQAGGKGGKAALGNTKAIRPNQTNVSNLKKLFDVFDIEGVGVITLDSLRKPRKGVDPVFLREVMSNLQNVPNTSADGSPITLTFNELMLDYVFSDCSPEQKELLLKWVPLEVTEEVIGRIQRIFDRFDDDFKGKVKLPAFIEALKETEFRKFVDDRLHINPILPPGKKKDDPLTFKEVCFVLFAEKQTAQYKKIIPNWKSSKVLTDTQLRDLQILFNKYDTEGQGVLNLAKLKKTMQANGKKSGFLLTDQELDSMFRDIDTDANGNISLHSFQYFYRDSWDSYINFDTDCLKAKQRDEIHLARRNNDAELYAHHSKAVLLPLNQGINAHLVEDETAAAAAAAAGEGAPTNNNINNKTNTVGAGANSGANAKTTSVGKGGAHNGAVRSG